jgi:hypothetical protein
MGSLITSVRHRSITLRSSQPEKTIFTTKAVKITKVRRVRKLSETFVAFVRFVVKIRLFAR